MKNEDENLMYKFLAIIAIVLLALWQFSKFQAKASSHSTVLGIIVGIIGSFLMIKILLSFNSESEVKPKNVAKKPNYNSLSDEEFISLVRNNFGNYNNIFEVEGVFGPRMLGTRYHTDNYWIESEYEDNECYYIITIKKRNGGNIIYKEYWTLSD